MRAEVTFSNRERSTFPESIPARSIGFPEAELSTITHVTFLRHQISARLSHDSPCPIQISIRSYTCPRSPAVTIAPHRSDTVPIPSHSKKIFVPKS